MPFSKGGVSGPEQDADAALAAVGHQLLEIHLGHDLHQVGRAVHGPAVVDEDVLQPVLCGEVDVVLVGSGVDACLEIDAVEVQGVPPVPGHLAGSDPRRIVDLRRRGQPVGHVRCEQVGILAGVDHHAPREGACALGAGDVVLPVEDDLLLVVVAARIGNGAGIGRQHAAQLRLLGRRGQEQTRVVPQIRFGEEQLAAFGSFDEHGKEHQPPYIELRHGQLDVGVLKGVRELPLEVAQFGAVHIGGVGREVGREVELRLFVLDGDLPLFARLETIGHAVVVEAYDQAVVAAEGECQLVVVVADLCLFVEVGVKRLVGRTLFGLDDPGIASQHLAAGERHRNGRGVQQRLPVGREGDPDLRIDRNGSLQVPSGEVIV